MITSTRELNVWDAPLSGINLVEASAGTGKTWNIEALVIRLLLTRELLPKNILVVTFTDAATQELRERILNRINQVYEVISDASVELNEDPFLSECRTRYGGDVQAIKSLERSKSEFDEASIYTIHSFCKNVLNDFSFEAGVDREINILSDSKLLIDEVIADYWRRMNQRLSRPENQIFSGLLLNDLTLDKIKKLFSEFTVQMHTRIDLVEDKTPAVWSGWSIDAKLDDFRARMQQLQTIWATEEAEIHKQLVETKINNNDYSKNFEKWKPDVIAFLEDPFMRLPKNYTEKFTQGFLDNRKPKNWAGPLPDHKFFQLLEDAIEMTKWMVQYELRTALTSLKTEYQTRRKRDQVLIYDDLLTSVDDALNESVNPAKATLLRKKLLDQYPVAMIDEFQDTDRVQYSIFRQIYVQDGAPENTLLYLIGDPKQSIYKFRGADLKTYFEARNEAKNHFTLSRNYRSAQNLVSAVNAVFDRDGSFIDAELAYINSDAHHQENPYFNDQESHEALRFIEIDTESSNKGESTSDLVAWVTQSIASQLQLSMDSKAGIKDEKESTGTRPIDAGDIAVLVSKHFQAKLIRESLTDIGIPCVETGDSNVFTSEESGLMSLLLECINDSRNLRKIRALLSSALFGMDVEEIESFENNDISWSEWIQNLNTSKELIEKYGVLTGIRHLFEVYALEQRLISNYYGERSITNIRHLTELIYAEEIKHHRSLSGIIHWLKAQRLSESKSEDSMKIRLESDDNRVKIVTMHSSKGLQYPIVYAPFLWDASWSKAGNNVCYDEVMDENGRITFTRKMDIGDYLNPNTSALSKLESWEDRIRLMYVAFTRAQYRCYVPYSCYKDNMISPMFGALVKSNVLDSDAFGRENYLEIVTGKVNPLGKEVPKDGVLSILMAKLAEKHSGLVYFESISSVDPAEPIKLDSEPKVIRVELFSDSNVSKLIPERSITSYSSIHRKYDQYETGAERIRDEEADIEYEESGEASPEIFRFPKGAHTGNLWHEIFELIDFSDDALHDGIVEASCIKHGFDPDVAKKLIKQLIQDTLGARLQGGLGSVGDSEVGRISRSSDGVSDMGDFSLSSLSPDHKLCEMEFLYRYDAAKMDSLIASLFAGEVERGSELDSGRHLEGDASEKNHFLVGLIDLIFEKDGKYYILDYKSNHLGFSKKDYTFDRIAEDIRKNKYNLQYYLYSAALNKYLSKQIYNYSYKEHFGGVFYLYWRGLTSGQSNGVFYDMPDEKVVMNLSKDIIHGNDTSAQPNINKSHQSDLFQGGDS